MKNSKPQAGQKLHTFIAVGGKPSQYNSVNKKQGKVTVTKATGSATPKLNIKTK